MATGVVRCFDVEKGVGSINPDDGSPEVFLHLSELDIGERAALRQNARVEFEAVPRPYGPQAWSITAVP